MNSIQLKARLHLMAEKNNPYGDYIHDIINIIMRQYYCIADYYEEDAEKTLTRFLNTGVLSF